MPTYSYACTACNHRFDVQQAFTDEALIECPQCSGRLRKVFGNVGVVFKGSGFYRNDARSDRSGGSKARSGSAAATATDGASSTSEATASVTGAAASSPAEKKSSSSADKAAPAASGSGSTSTSSS